MVSVTTHICAVLSTYDTHITSVKVEVYDYGYMYIYMVLHNFVIYVMLEHVLYVLAPLKCWYLTYTLRVIMLQYST